MARHRRERPPEGVPEDASAGDGATTGTARDDAAEAPERETSDPLQLSPAPEPVPAVRAASRRERRAQEAREAEQAQEADTSADTGAQSLGRNILWNYLSGFTSIFGLLLLYPLAVSIVGASSYGLWVLAIGAIQMLTMTDFGLGSGVVRMLTGIAEGPGTQRERRRFVTSAVLVFMVLGAVLTLVYLVAFPLYLGTVDVEPQDQGLVVPMTLMAAGTLFLSMVGRGLNSVLWGLNRPDIERKAAVVAIIGRALGYGAVLLTDTGLLGIAVVECLSLALPPVVCLIAVVRRFRAPVLDLRLWADHVRPLLRLSSVMSIGSLALLGVYQLPLFLVGPTLGLSAATAFGALMRVYQSCRLVVGWITMPYGYPLRVAGTEQAARVFVNVMTLTLGMAMLMGVALVAIPTELMTAWMGSDFVFAAAGLSVLAIGLVAEAVGQPATMVMTLRGSPMRASLLSLLVLVLTLPAVWAATQTHSIAWVALATVLPSFLVCWIQLLAAHRDLPYRITGADLRRWAFMLAGAVVYGLLAFAAARFLPAWPTIALVAVGLGVMALRMLRQVRADGALVAEAMAEAGPDDDEAPAATGPGAPDGQASSAR